MVPLTGLALSRSGSDERRLGLLALAHTQMTSGGRFTGVVGGGGRARTGARAWWRQLMCGILESDEWIRLELGFVANIYTWLADLGLYMGQCPG
jgi:hypothetical protein